MVADNFVDFESTSLKKKKWALLLSVGKKNNGHVAVTDGMFFWVVSY